MEGPRQSFLVTGNCKTSSGIISLHIPTSIKYGLWQICIKSIIFNCKVSIDKAISFHSNVVSNFQFSKTDELESLNSVLALVYLKCNAQKTIAFDLNENWFVINNPSEFLQIILKHVDYETNDTLINDEINVAMFIMFKQIR